MTKSNLVELELSNSVTESNQGWIKDFKNKTDVEVVKSIVEVNDMELFCQIFSKKSDDIVDNVVMRSKNPCQMYFMWLLYHIWLAQPQMQCMFQHLVHKYSIQLSSSMAYDMCLEL